MEGRICDLFDEGCLLITKYGLRDDLAHILRPTHFPPTWVFPSLAEVYPVQLVSPLSINKGFSELTQRNNFHLITLKTNNSGVRGKIWIDLPKKDFEKITCFSNVSVL